MHSSNIPTMNNGHQFDDGWLIITVVMKFWKSILTIIFVLCSAEFTVIMTVNRFINNIAITNYEHKIQIQEGIIKSNGDKIKEQKSTIDKLENDKEKINELKLEIVQLKNEIAILKSK